MFENKSNETENEYHMEDLQEEMLVIIFQYLTAKDLKSLLMTSRYFHNVIISSLTLMRKIILKFNYKYKFEYDYLASSFRRYQRLRIVESSSQDTSDPLLKFIPTFNQNLTEVEFRGCSFKKSDFREILRNLPQLRKFVITNTIIEDLTGSSGEIPVLDKLTFLKISHSNFCFDLFKSSRNLNEMLVDLSGMKNHLLELEGFDEFLPSQKNLKHLELTDLLDKDAFLKDFGSEINFQLETLKINQCHFKQIKNFEKFLKTQKNIRNFDLSFQDRNEQEEVEEFGQYLEVLDHILRLKSLRSVVLEFSHLNPIRSAPSFLQANENVDFLTCNFNGLCSERIIKLFPNLKHLELKAKFMNEEQVDFLNQFLAKLESLKVVNFPSDFFRKLKFKNLAAIEICETNIEPDSWEEFINNNPGIKKLVINYAFFMEMTNEVIDTLTKRFKNLVHFELLDKYIGTKNDIYQTICENCPNLKYLKLYNINIEENFSDLDKNYLKSRGIKFDLFNDVSLSKVSWIF